GYDPPHELETLDLQSFTFAPHGALDGLAELTSTPDADLFGYFSDLHGATQRVEQIDRQTGVALQSYPIAEMGVNYGTLAVAVWGGIFWIFVGDDDQYGEAPLFRYHPGDAEATKTLDTHRRILAAGASTCAP